MSKHIYAGAITLAIIGSIGFAAAQRGPGADRPNLTPTQERTVSQGLAASPSQAAPVGVQPQVGNILPASLAAQALPSDVSDRVPSKATTVRESARQNRIDRSGDQAGDRNRHGRSHYWFESQQLRPAFPVAADGDRMGAALRLSEAPKLARRVPGKRW